MLKIVTSGSRVRCQLQLQKYAGSPSNITDPMPPFNVDAPSPLSRYRGPPSLFVGNYLAFPHRAFKSMPMSGPRRFACKPSRNALADTNRTSLCEQIVFRHVCMIISHLCEWCIGTARFATDECAGVDGKVAATPSAVLSGKSGALRRRHVSPVISRLIS